MKCFYHDDREAVGACKSCGKGLCRDCAVELKKGLACKGRCEADVQAVIDLVERSILVSPATAPLLQSGNSARMGAVGFYLLLGVVFTVGGYLRSESVDFIVVIGLCFIAYGAFAFFQARKIAAASASATRKPSP